MIKKPKAKPKPVKPTKLDSPPSLGYKMKNKMEAKKKAAPKKGKYKQEESSPLASPVHPLPKLANSKLGLVETQTHNSWEEKHAKLPPL